MEIEVTNEWVRGYKLNATWSDIKTLFSVVINLETEVLWR